MSNREIYNNWKTYLESRGVQDDVKNQYLTYIKTLLDKKVPIIFNFDHLSHLLGRNKAYLASVVNSPNNHYREFKIKKRSGGFRKITTPYPALLEMQYWIYNNILKTVSIHSSAHGFTHKKSIITNSKIHAGQKHLLKLDLTDYFPSIQINRIIHIFKELGYPNIVAFYLAQICCYNNQLPQGAPTSPILSNIVARRIDKRLVHLAKKYDLKYTRYADDLTFSGSTISAIFISYINNIIVDEGFEINESKTRLYQQKSKRIVTGISVINDKIKIPREYKRDLKLELHYIFKYGLKSHMAKNKIRKANYLFVILGKVNFWLSVEPDNENAKTAKIKLKELI
jgi:hypothetical protein